MIAKEIKRSAQRELVQQTFRDTLFNGTTMRVNNYNIVSKAHNNMTVKQNKIALSPFDSKRFLLFDGNSTVSFGRKVVEESAFLADIYIDTEWANSYNEADNNSPEFQFRIGDFYSGPTQKPSCEKKKLLVDESLDVPL